MKCVRITQHRVPDGVVDFGRTVYGRGLGVGEMYEIYSVLFAVYRLGQFALLAVVYDYLIVLAARYYVVAGGREVEAVDLVGVLAEHLRDFEAAHDVVYQLHGSGLGRGTRTVVRPTGRETIESPRRRRRLRQHPSWSELTDATVRHRTLLATSCEQIQGERTHVCVLQDIHEHRSAGTASDRRPARALSNGNVEHEDKCGRRSTQNGRRIFDSNAVVR